MSFIGGKLCSNCPNDLNHLPKDSKDIVSVIINTGNDIRGGDTVFYNVVKTSDLGSRAHILKHLHGIMIFGRFGKNFIKLLLGVDIDP